MNITLEHVAFSSGDTELIHDISLEIKSGSAILVMGPSGSGKTLLMKIMAGITPADRGEVYLDDRGFSSMGDRELDEMRVRHGFVFQDSALWQNLSVYQNLALPIEYHFPRRPAAEIKTEIERLCRKMAFTEDLSQRPTRLSSGERKIASILRALVLDPETVYMDEPSAGLDSIATGKLLDLLKELKQRGKGLVIASHDSEIASMIADKIIVIDGGRIIAYDDVQTMVRTEDKRVREILSDVFDLSSTYDADILDILGSGDSDPFG